MVTVRPRAISQTYAVLTLHAVVFMAGVAMGISTAKDVKQAMATVQKCVMPTPGSVVLEVLLLVFLQCYHLLSQLWLQ